MQFFSYSPDALARRKEVRRKDDADLVRLLGVEAVQARNALFPKDMLSSPEELIVPAIVSLPNEGLLPE